MSYESSIELLLKEGVQFWNNDTRNRLTTTLWMMNDLNYIGYAPRLFVCQFLATSSLRLENLYEPVANFTHRH